jgi:hypothetical protein
MLLLLSVSLSLCLHYCCCCCVRGCPCCPFSVALSVYLFVSLPLCLSVAVTVAVYVSLSLCESLRESNGETRVTKMRACLCTFFFKAFMHILIILSKKHIHNKKIGKAAEYATPTARQPAHARDVLAQYDIMSPPTVRVLAFAQQHILSLSFVNITNYKYV